jgi:hypothetical protein
MLLYIYNTLFISDLNIFYSMGFIKLVRVLYIYDFDFETKGCLSYVRACVLWRKKKKEKNNDIDYYSQNA